MRRFAGSPRFVDSIWSCLQWIRITCKGREPALRSSSMVCVHLRPITVSAFPRPPSSQSSQQMLKTTESLPKQFFFGSSLLRSIPFPICFHSGNTNDHLATHSCLNPSRSAALTLGKLLGLAFQTIRRRPIPPLEGGSSVYRNKRPIAFDVTCVRWKDGKTNTGPISLDKLLVEVSKSPMTPANAPSSPAPGAFVLS
jgi:hypothetical protein